MNINDTENLITNGTFDSNLDDWNPTTTIPSMGMPIWNYGSAVLADGGSISQTVTIAGGGTYLLSYAMKIVSSYESMGSITVTSAPSGALLFKSTATGNQSSISLTVTETTDTQITIMFNCSGGEVDVDNVSLVMADKVFVVGGDFSDPTLPGWIQTGNSAGTMPSVVGGQLSLTSGTSVYQDIVIEDAFQLELTCTLSIPDGAAGTFSVTSRPTYSSSASTTLYSSNSALSGQPLFFFLPESETVIRLTFSCTSGEVDVDNVVMDYASSTIITEVQMGGHEPWISPGTSGVVEFNVQFNTPGSGDYIQFTAPTDTTLVDASIPGLEKNSDYTFDAPSGILTLKASGLISWGTVELTLAVSSSATPNATLGDGTAQYFAGSGISVGDIADITVISATVTITEQSVAHEKVDGGTYTDAPWIFPGMSGDVTFSVAADSTDGAGSYLLFTAPTYTDTSGSTPATENYSNITNATLDGLTAGVDYSFSDNRLTLLQDITWSKHLLTLTLAVDSNMPRFGTLDNGKVQYVRSDGQAMGTPANITVIAASGNAWDNVKSVKACCIGMMSDDGSACIPAATLFVNKTDDYDGHSIRVFVGFTFNLYSTDMGWTTDYFDGPTEDDLFNALTLTGLSGQTPISVSGVFAQTSYSNYAKEYYRSTASAPDSVSTSGFGVSTYLNYSCPIYYDYLNPNIPEGITNVYIELNAQLSNGKLFYYLSNGETPACLAVNFVAQKKYQYSSTPGNSNYIIINNENANGTSLYYHDNGETRKTGTVHQLNIYRVKIDATPENSKYVFVFSKGIDVTLQNLSDNQNAVFVHGVGKSMQAQWYNYGEFFQIASEQSPENSVYIADNGFIGYTSAHEASGWVTSGQIEGEGGGLTINAGELGFAGLSVDYESVTSDVWFTANNSSNSDGSSRLKLIDNFGNHIYMNPQFGADDESLSFSLVINDK